MKEGTQVRARTTLLLLPALALAACGGGEKTVTKTKTVTVAQTATTPATTPTTATTPATTPTVPEPSPATNVVHVSSFRTPSSNIGCAIAGGSARCDIKQRDWEPPPKPADCDVDFGQGIAVGGRGPSFVCAGDTALNPTGPVVPYGTDTQVGRFLCASREDGVTCQNTATKRGFFIARDRYRLF
jgi:hypothetical protein